MMKGMEEDMNMMTDITRKRERRERRREIERDR